MQPAALLQLMWLSSPSLPVGGFSYSEGLEAAVDAQLVQTEADALGWLSDQLHLSLARGDLAAVWLATRAMAQGSAAQVAALDDWVCQSRESAEFRLQTEQMGKSLQAWAANLGHAPAQPARSFPISFAQAACASAPGATADDVAYAFGFAWLENMVAASVRSVPLGQSAGQRILAALCAQLPEALAHATTRSLDTLQSFTPGLAMLSARHEHQYSRLFRS